VGRPTRDREPGAEDAVRAIRFDHISKRFPGAARLAVDDCCFRVAAGAFVVLLGPSGCGKTTLLRLVAGLEALDAGAIWIGDARVDALEPAERDVAMVFQNYALYPHLSVFDNIAFPLRTRRVARPRRQVGDALVAEEHLAGVGRHEAGQDAQQRRLAAAGWAEEDEALAGVDVEIDRVGGDVRPESLRHALEPDAHRQPQYTPAT